MHEGLWTTAIQPSSICTFTLMGFIALAKSKEAMVRSSGRSLEEAFLIESECTKVNAATHDAVEGPRAFMEKREPNFLGR